MLQIKPVLGLHAGEFHMERVRTRHGACSRVMDFLTQLAPFLQLTLIHTYAPGKSDLLHQQAPRLWPDGGEPLVAIEPIPPQPCCLRARSGG